MGFSLACGRHVNRAQNACPTTVDALRPGVYIFGAAALATRFHAGGFLHALDPA
jgi:hypothetical protein